MRESYTLRHEAVCQFPNVLDILGEQDVPKERGLPNIRGPPIEPKPMIT